MDEPARVLLTRRRESPRLLFFYLTSLVERDNGRPTDGRRLAGLAFVAEHPRRTVRRGGPYYDRIPTHAKGRLRTSAQTEVLYSTNVRRIEGSFAWIDHRLLRNGYLAVMTHADQALYLFLALAADRHGVSFYRKERICGVLGLDFGQFEVARDRLIDLKLIAFEPYSAATPNGHYQVLPVDGRPADFTQQALDQLGLSAALKAPAGARNPRR
jgi:hypothetical protein